MKTPQELEAIYRIILERGEREGAPAHFQALSRVHVDGSWRGTEMIFDASGVDFSGKVVLDFGSKYGHLAPFLRTLGAREIVGVERMEENVDWARRIVAPLLPDVSFQQTTDGRIPLAPASCDVVLLFEVISHVHPSHLYGIYEDVARVLRPERR